MTTKRKFKIGAEIGVCANDSSYKYWSAKIRLYEVEAVPAEEGGGLTDLTNGALNPVTFYVSGSDYHLTDLPVHVRKRDLGLNHHGMWQLETEYCSSMMAGDAIEAGKRCLALERKEMKLIDVYGSPSCANDCLKRALVALKPFAIRICSHYQGTGKDARSCWQVLRGTRPFDYLISCEMEKFRMELQAKRPDLFEVVEEGVAT